MEVVPHPAFRKDRNAVPLAGLGKNVREDTPVAFVFENDCLAIAT